MSREELNMHSLTLIPDDTLTLVAKMVFVQVGFFVANCEYFGKIHLQHPSPSCQDGLNVSIIKVFVVGAEMTFLHTRR